MTRDTLWSAAELEAITKGQWTIAMMATDQITGVSIDSRTAEPGDLFIAIAGPNSDGHDYVAAAFQNGAAAAIISKPTAQSAGPTLTVQDTFAALQALGIAGRERSTAKVIAITGSVGKTGTKEALSAVLAENGRTHKSVLSYNNHWGVPLTLARMPRNTEFAVLELGMNHPGELAPLSRMAAPHVAVITRIAPAHMAAFESLADIAAAKSEIFLGLVEGGTAIIHADSEHYTAMASAAKAAGADIVIGFGRSDEAGARILDSAARQTFSCVRAQIGNDRITYKIGAAGEHWVENSVAVLAAANAVGADLGRAGLTLARFQPPKGRGNEYRVDLNKGSYTLIDDSYNANPTSMAAALEALGTRDVDENSRRMAVIGDMLELGKASKEFHGDLKDHITRSGIDLVFACGSEIDALIDVLPAARLGGRAKTAEDLYELVQDAVRDGDVLLVKASRGIGLDRLVGHLRANGELHSHDAEGGRR